MTRMLYSTRGSIWSAVIAIVGALLVLACGGKLEYKLEGERPSAQIAVAESTDGSWTVALGELILPLIDEHDTEYAQGYSEEVFRSLQLGSNRAIVEQLLGSPLLVKEFSDEKTYWYYSRHGTQAESYFVRILVFDREGILLARRSYFYAD